MKKVLIVEDDLQLQLVYQDLLKDMAVEILLAITATQGMHFVETHAPDLILLDLMLPSGYSGMDMLKDLKKNPAHASIPVVVLSNLDSERNNALALGANDYFVKAETPVGDIAAVIRKYLQV